MMWFDWKTLREFLLIIPFFVLVTCSKSGGQDRPFISIETEQARYEETLLFHFENITSDTVAIHTSGCGSDTREILPSFVIQQQSEGGKWTDAGSPICIEIATKPIILAPGEQESIQIPVKLGLEEAQIAGLFRYVFDIRRHAVNGTKAETELDHSLRVSPPVEIIGE